MTIGVAKNWTHVVRKFGVAGFAFFLVKGILWLLAPFVFAWLI